MSRHHTALAALALSTLLAGCTGSMLDPYSREGNWRPSGANEANLLQMLAEPNDYSRGQAAPDARGDLAAQAVERLLQDRVRALPTTTTTQALGGGVQ